MNPNFLIVGSGAGGATLAKELAIRGKNVTIVERGRFHKLGTERRAMRFYTGGFSPGEKVDGGTTIFKTIMVGGTTMVTLGCCVKPPQQDLRRLGIDLDKELEEAERELAVSLVPENFMGERTKILRKASEELGYSVKPMPKFIDFKRCTNCGLCVTGCRYGARWSALKPLGEARKAGAKLLTNTSVEEVLYRDGEVKGVKTRGPSGSQEISADKVILAAGGLSTPIILQRSGLEAGDGLFVDLFINTYGMIEKHGIRDELGMATIINQFHESDGLILTPILDTCLHMLLYLPLLKKMRAFNRDKMLGLMTKIADDSSGKIESNGRICKPITKNDWRKLEKGVELSKNILRQAGVNPRSFLTTEVRGAHPGGTAAIGKTVNKEFETEINGLYVCDSSLLPASLGNPPVLTIVALAKRLGALLTAG